MSVARKTGRRLVYVATATPGDPEMAGRIERHKKARGDGWRTVEEPLNLAEALSGLKGGDGAVVIDCLTLWLSNLMMAGGMDSEDSAGEKALELAGAMKGLGGTVVVVSNEVGMGIVPENALARRFRDAAGTVNRIIAEAADEVYLMVSGMPVKIK
jgi:adenosylcobinamide kinase/adenosylcobinamide-phosphate guanylyltransferase